MTDPTLSVELAEMMARFKQAYGDRITILPDGETVTVGSPAEARTASLIRGQPVWFQRDQPEWRAGTLRFALRYENRPEGVVTQPGQFGIKIFRIPVAQLRFTPPDAP